MNISVVIPLLNEEESLIDLHDWIVSIMEKNDFSYEIIFIDDGSTDNSWKIISNLSRKNPQVNGFRFQKNFGKSQALHLGFSKAKGNVIITMDADLQDNPDEIPELYKIIAEQNYDLVSGWKKKRYDSVLFKNIPSKLFNWAARKVSGVRLHDFNCGLKAYKNEVVKNTNVSGEMHRYIPVLVKNAGYNKITEKEVRHQPRKFGKTKFGNSRFINGFMDLITIWFLLRFGKQPMYLFGTLGVLMFVIGFCSALYIGISKLYRLYNDLPYTLVANNTWFYIALTTMIMGTMLFLAGFLGELILRNNPSQENYKVAESVENE